MYKWTALSGLGYPGRCRACRSPAHPNSPRFGGGGSQFWWLHLSSHLAPQTCIFLHYIHTLPQLLLLTTLPIAHPSSTAYEVGRCELYLEGHSSPPRLNFMQFRETRSMTHRAFQPFARPLLIHLSDSYWSATVLPGVLGEAHEEPCRPLSPRGMNVSARSCVLMTALSTLPWSRPYFFRVLLLWPTSGHPATRLPSLSDCSSVIMRPCTRCARVSRGSPRTGGPINHTGR